MLVILFFVLAAMAFLYLCVATLITYPLNLKIKKRNCKQTNATTTTRNEHEDYINIKIGPLSICNVGIRV